jgi:hypothetical protein
MTSSLSGRSMGTTHHANGVPFCVYLPGKSAGIRRRSVPLMSAADVIAR